MTAGCEQDRLSWLALIPRDTMMIRDGRSFDAAQNVSAQTVRPWPATMAGAVGASFGAKPGATPVTAPGTVPEEVRGPVLGRSLDGIWEPYFPVPADLVQEAGGDDPRVFRRLSPKRGDARTDLDAAGLSWMAVPEGAGKVKPLEGWLPGSALTKYLAGDPPPGDSVRRSALRAADPFREELRIGVARDHGRQVRAGFLYRAAHWRLEEGWGFLAACALRAGWDRVAAGPVQFGGRGRLADVQEAGDVTWPARPAGFPGGRVLVYLATPALWPGGGRIPVPVGVDLVAAATGEPEPVATSSPGEHWRSSWSLRWAVPAGSVYLLDFGDHGRAAEWAEKWHGTAYGLDGDDPVRTAGFGVVLTGVWM